MPIFGMDGGKGSTEHGLPHAGPDGGGSSTATAFPAVFYLVPGAFPFFLVCGRLWLQKPVTLLPTSCVLD